MSPTPLAGQPQIFITSPKENTKIFGDKATVSFFLKNFTFADGLVLVWVDTPLKDPAAASFLTSLADFTLENLGAGPHLVTLELVTPKGAPLSPPAVKTVSFQTVENVLETPSPTVQITPTVYPAAQLPAQTLFSSSLLVTVALICIFSAIWLFRKKPPS